MSSDNNLSVLVIEPYYGGSHRAFLDGLMSRLPFEFVLLAHPPRKWKWRMRMAAPRYAELIEDMGRSFDVVLCSTFIDVAALRGLGPGWLREVPVLVYYHENQFAYPVQHEKQWDPQFGLINMTTALAADAIAFNSKYNLESFLEGIEEIMGYSTDMPMNHIVDDIREKARVLSPPIDFSFIDELIDGNNLEGGNNKGVANKGATGGPVIVWNHRWEYDKGPDEFFEALYALVDNGVDFNLAVMGESFNRIPPVFEAARERLGSRVVHFGYARDRAEYVQWLRRADIVVSTSIHEFFGISVMEAVRAGCRPVLPRRLSYPELFPDGYLYDEGGLAKALEKALYAGRISQEDARSLTEPHSLDTLSMEFSRWIEDAVDKGA